MLVQDSTHFFCATGPPNLCVSATIRWISNALLAELDALSCTVDYDDWKVWLPFFKFLSERWGSFTTDWLADHSNAKLKLFYSKYYCPETFGVNAFLYSWRAGNNYLTPPVYLLCKSINHLQYFG